MEEININNRMALGNYEKNKKIYGVYIWGYYENAYFIPLYVGKSQNIHERLIQHYCRLISGEYRIPNIQILIDIHTGKIANNKDIKLEWLYVPLSINSVVNEFSTPNIQEIIKRIKEKFAFRYVEIKLEDDRKKAEIYIASRIGKNILISSVKGSSNQYINKDIEELLPPYTQ
jgi:hypothetical protein